MYILNKAALIDIRNKALLPARAIVFGLLFLLTLNLTTVHTRQPKQ